MRHKPVVVKGHDFESDPVMKDLRENFREEDVREKKTSSFWRKVFIAVLVLLAVLYVLFRVGL